MTYTPIQQEQIRTNIQKIVSYIEDNILPHITYCYETGTFGPRETWGRSNEKHGQRYYIAVNGPYADKIRFYHGISCYNAETLANKELDHAVNFLKYWQDAKMYMHQELQSLTEINNTISMFVI